jgi:hypothetical protein
MKRAHNVVKGQTGPRRRYEPVDEETEELKSVVKMLWDLMLLVSVRGKGYDATTLAVKWYYGDGTEVDTTVQFVIVEYGKSVRVEVVETQGDEGGGICRAEW